MLIWFTLVNCFVNYFELKKQPMLPAKSLKKVLVHSPGQEVHAHDPFVEGHSNNLVFLPMIEDEHDYIKDIIASFIGKDNVLEFRGLLNEVFADRVTKDEFVNICYRNNSLDLLTHQKLKGLDGEVFIDSILSGFLPDENKKRFKSLHDLARVGALSKVVDQRALIGEGFSGNMANELISFLIEKHEVFNVISNVINTKTIAQKYLKENEGLELGGLAFLGENHILIGHKDKEMSPLVKKVAEEILLSDKIEGVIEVRLPRSGSIRSFGALFTQIHNHEYLVHSSLLFDGRKVSVLEHKKDKSVKWKNLHDLILSVDSKAKIIHCARDVSSTAEREQWTFACDTFVLKPGVLMMYDRNPETLKSLIDAGYRTIEHDLYLAKVRRKEIIPENMEDTVITIPCGELYRFAGGLSELIFMF